MHKLNPECTLREVASFLSWVMTSGFTAGGRNLSSEMKISISSIRQRRKASAVSEVCTAQGKSANTVQLLEFVFSCSDTASYVPEY